MQKMPSRSGARKHFLQDWKLNLQKGGFGVKKVDVIVAASGRLFLEGSEGMTGKDVLELALDKWGIDGSILLDPFVVKVDGVSGRHEVCELDKEIGKIYPERGDVLRVVLPMKENVQD